MTIIYDLLYQLGVTANYTGFFHTAYAISLCAEQPASAGDEVALSRGGEAVRHKLEGGGAEYPNRELHHLAGKPAPAGGAGPQAPGSEAPQRRDAVNSGFVAGCRPPGNSRLGRGSRSQKQ